MNEIQSNLSAVVRVLWILFTAFVFFFVPIFFSILRKTKTKLKCDTHTNQVCSHMVIRFFYTSSHEACVYIYRCLVPSFSMVTCLFSVFQCLFIYVFLFCRCFLASLSNLNGTARTKSVSSCCLRRSQKRVFVSVFFFFRCAKLMNERQQSR